MKIKEAILRLQAEELAVSDADFELSGGYAGDFLSFVMGKAPEGCCWFTVMSNINVAGVAQLAEIGLIVLCEGVKPEPMLLDKCKKMGINIVSTPHDMFNAVALYLGK